jgi:hypothetical protein
MLGIVTPAIALMARLRFRTKFLLVGGITTLLWSGSASRRSAALHERVRMIESERSAVALMATLVEWNKVLIENRAS